MTKKIQKGANVAWTFAFYKHLNPNGFIPSVIGYLFFVTKKRTIVCDISSGKFLKRSKNDIHTENIMINFRRKFIPLV
jgi:hypothetical protein